MNIKEPARCTVEDFRDFRYTIMLGDEAMAARLGSAAAGGNA
ncbi:hypothetical protein [Variovorax sp. dw_308]|nr:hypothetical protein [Variovorax sp. dw_308]